jgi:dienelactone hydrolase
VPDLYRGASADAFPRALFLALTAPAERLLADTQSAYDYLVSLDRVDSQRIGILGMSLGGGVALRYATQNPDIKVIVNAYGAVLTDPNALRSLGGPVLGVFGAKDLFVRPAQVAQFEAALAAAGVESTIVVDPTLGDDFLRFPDVANPGLSAYEAWQQIVVFLETNLKS